MAVRQLVRIRCLVSMLAVSCFAAAAQAEPSAARPVLDLDGFWTFATDPDDVGESEQWFLPGKRLPKMPLPEYASAANGRIVVPGSWDTQGYGSPVGMRHHRFLGKGWYQRSVTLPADWIDRSIYLTIGGVHRSCKVWVNGHLRGEHIGSFSALEYEVTSAVTAGGDATIVIQVDSRRDKLMDPFRGTIDGLFADGEWGGVWGHVRLEARGKAYLDDVWVRTTRIDAPEISVNIQLAGDAALARQVRVNIVDQSGRSVAGRQLSFTPDETKDGRLLLPVTVAGAALWSPDEPNLYTAEVSLTDGREVIDAVSQRFGIREFKTDGQYFLLNGNRIFLAGAGDDNIYPDDFGGIYAGKEQFLQRAKLMKSFGFNSIRTHSSVMSPEYYDVCDELGLLVRAELPLNGIPALRQVGAKPGFELTAKAEFRNAIVRHRNHPSLYSWSLGNELRPGNDPALLKIAAQYQEILKQLQPESLFIDGANTAYYRPGDDGVNVHYNVIEELRRDTLDYSSPVNYSEGPPYEFGGVAFDQSANPQPKPAVIHESGEFVTFPNLLDRHQFRHSIRPLWLEKMASGYAELGLAAENPLWTEVSEKLYYHCQKLEMENIRLQDSHAGYDFWLFQDYWDTANGLLTHYLQPKQFVPAKKFRTFNDSQTVLLKNGLQLTYRSGQPLKTTFLVWHYAPQAIAGSKFEYAIHAGTQLLAAETIDAVSAAPGGVTSIAAAEVSLPATADPVQLRLTAKLTCEERTVENEWTAELFPESRAAIMTTVPVITKPDFAEAFSHYQARPLAPTGPLSPQALYIVDRLDERLVDALEQGARVILIHPRTEMFPAYTIMRWRSAYWSGNTKRRSVGQLIYDHPLTRAITAENWFSHEWWYLFEDSRSYFLDRLPAEPDVLVRNIDGPPAVSNKALLFEARVGNGYLLVSGLNHLHHAERPEVQWVMDRMVQHADARPRPRAEFPPASLRQRLTDVP